MPRFKMSQGPMPFTGEGLIFIKDGNNILQHTENYTIFFEPELFNLSENDIKNLMFVGELEGRKIFALEKSNAQLPNTDYIKNYLYLDSLNPEELKAVFRGCQLLNWNKQSSFCGCCGNPMHIKAEQFVKQCEANTRHLFYPQYSPSMIVVVRNRNKLLLGRSPHFPPGLYTALAGFIEAGETAEDAVRREVMEEVGIEITNIRPVKTAHWPFPNSLMLGFEADAVTTELVLDPKEIEDAGWYHYKDLPARLPLKATLARELITLAVARCERDDLVMKSSGRHAFFKADLPASTINATVPYHQPPS